VYNVDGYDIIPERVIIYELYHYEIQSSGISLSWKSYNIILCNILQSLTKSTANRLD